MRSLPFTFVPLLLLAGCGDAPGERPDFMSDHVQCPLEGEAYERMMIGQVLAGGRVDRPSDPSSFFAYSEGRVLDNLQHATGQRAWARTVVDQEVEIRQNRLYVGGVDETDRYRVDGRIVLDGWRVENGQTQCIRIKDDSSQITIRNSMIGPCRSHAVYLVVVDNETIRDVEIHDNFLFKSRKGVFVDRWVDRQNAAIEDVRTHHNHFLDMRGNASKLHIDINQSCPGGNKTPTCVHGSDLGNNVHYVGLTTGPLGNSVANNLMVQQYGADEHGVDLSRMEDVVNVGFYSKGTSSLPIRVESNYSIGGTRSDSGGGFLVGDSATDHAHIVGNVLVNPGTTGYSLSIAGGHFNRVENNVVYKAAGLGGVGLWMQAWGSAAQAYGCLGHEVRGNRVRVDYAHPLDEHRTYPCRDGSNPGYVAVDNDLTANLHPLDGSMPLPSEIDAGIRRWAPGEVPTDPPPNPVFDGGAPPPPDDPPTTPPPPSDPPQTPPNPSATAPVPAPSPNPLPVGHSACR